MKLLKVSVVVVGALIVTALGIDASDTWRGSNSTLLGQLMGGVSPSVCPEGMVEVLTGRTFSCADVYEVSAGRNCPHPEPKSLLDTTGNLEAGECGVVSVAAAVPWRYVSRADAQRLCARAGKRLPTAAEWFTLALDTNEKACRVAKNVVGRSGESAECRSAAGVYDAVGNVWEWVSDDVIEGQYRNRPLPPPGRVLQADADGVAIMTGEHPAPAYGTAYFWSQSEGSFGMIRGGFYGSKEDAGVYTVHAQTPAEFVGEAIGFRCVR